MVINPIVGVYIPIIRIPIKGGMTIPNIATFDHGTYVFIDLIIYIFDSVNDPLSMCRFSVELWQMVICFDTVDG